MNTVRNKTHRKHNRPCIGILTIPHMSDIKYGKSHIMKTYVDWFEERGVCVIAIPYNTTEHESYFKLVNGLLIPGGETTYILKNVAFRKTVERFIELSFDENEYFPIWGTCFGFQMLLSVIGNIKKFKKYPSHGLYPIHITQQGFESRLFNSFSKRYLHYLENFKATSENHEYGISPNDFMENNHLRRFYTILSTTFDENKNEYVSAIEAKYYPIYGVQWHPERQKTYGTPFVDFFISELRKNKHKSHSQLPYLGTIKKPYKCIQYPEHKELYCYFF
jgi:gamma-glutamyl hydrolase